jgi:PAS domain S-box-containing protein
MAKPARRRARTPRASTAGLRKRVAALEGRARRVRNAERELRESELRYRVLAEQSSLGIVIHKGFVVRYANPALVTLFGYATTEEVLGRDLRGVLAPADRPRVEQYSSRRLQGEPAPPRYRCQAVRRDGTRLWVEVTASGVTWGGEAAVLATVVDITERTRSEELACDQSRLAQMVARGTPLHEVLETLVRTIEAHSDGMVASILLLDADGVHLRHGAAPSLPESYTSAIDGLPIGPDVGSCGSAAYLGEPVVVSKIETDARWVPFRELAHRHGLRACWSTPIKSSDGRVLGTVALYYREPREPGLWELKLIDMATRLAGIAIDRHHADEALRRSDDAEREATALRSVTHLANATAHEINNPLTVILGRLTMLASREADPATRLEWLTASIAAAERIRHIILRMHEITRLEYLPDPAHGLPPTLDLRKSSAEGTEAAPP